MFRRNAVGVVLALLLVLTGCDDGYEKGVAAYVRQDYATALTVWRPLAEQGHAAAQFHLGYMYASGQGFAKDYSQAVKWYRKAAEQGHARAQTYLGVFYQYGPGVPQDYSQAVK